jgi:outer membrane biosynthesis protein TonB
MNTDPTPVIDPGERDDLDDVFHRPVNDTAPVPDQPDQPDQPTPPFPEEPAVPGPERPSPPGPVRPDLPSPPEPPKVPEAPKPGPPVRPEPPKVPEAPKPGPPCSRSRPRCPIRRGLILRGRTHRVRLTRSYRGRGLRIILSLLALWTQSLLALWTQSPLAQWILICRGPWILFTQSSRTTPNRPAARSRLVGRSRPATRNRLVGRSCPWIASLRGALYRRLFSSRGSLVPLPLWRPVWPWPAWSLLLGTLGSMFSMLP